MGTFFYIRLSLTIFSFYRNISYASPVKTATITDPYSGNQEILDRVNSYIPRFVSLFLPKVRVESDRRKILKDSFKAFPILRSSPQASRNHPTSTHP